jgi:hypothetical protein
MSAPNNDAATIKIAFQTLVAAMTRDITAIGVRRCTKAYNGTM